MPKKQQQAEREQRIIELAEENEHLKQSLAESEGRYKSLFEKSFDAFYLHDLKGNILDASNSALSMLGYGRDEFPSLNLFSLLPEDQCHLARQCMSELMDSGIMKEPTEFMLRRKDGKCLWVEVNASMIYREGAPFAVQGIARDITERKLVEEILRVSEERYRAIFESSGTAKIIADDATVILLANAGFEKLSGYSKQELENVRSWMDFIAEEDLERVRTCNRMRLRDPASVPKQYEFRFKNRHGEIRNIFLSADVIPGKRQIVASCLDITDRKRMEEHLRESEERFRGLAELLPQTVYETDRTGMLTFVNKGAHEQFGYNRKDFRKGLDIYQMIAPQDRDAIRKAFRKILSGHKAGLRECTALRKDGSTFFALIHSSAIHHNGVPAGVRGFLIDISEKKGLEKQLMRAQKMEAIGTLAGGIAHDFNNLLMGIQGNASLVLLDMDSSDPRHERLKNIEQYVRSGAELTRQLLGFARGGKYEVRPTDLGRFLEKSSEMFARTKKEVRIHREIAQGLPAVDMDRGQMEQVFLNLYVNAWQAMPGGGDLYIRAESVLLSDETASILGLNPENHLKVSITDNGMGMDKETMDRIFEPFFTTKEMGRGTGLGLASVYGIVKNHGGVITVESTKGAGATFTIYLPASREQAVKGEDPASAKVCPGHETILLVDDESMILDVGSEMLASIGYRVMKANSGAEALRLYRENQERIKLVILDMIMPDMGGEKTYDAIKVIDPCAKVLLSSGYSIDGRAGDILSKGCQGFIQKPFDFALLSEKVRKILEDGH